MQAGKVHVDTVRGVSRVVQSHEVLSHSLHFAHYIAILTGNRVCGMKRRIDNVQDDNPYREPSLKPRVVGIIPGHCARRVHIQTRPDVCRAARTRAAVHVHW